MKRSRTPEARTPINKDEIDRNRPGSLFVEVDLQAADTAQKVGAYYIDLQARHKRWEKATAPYTAPELFPGATEVELALLDRLISDGRVNLWDESIELMNPDGSLSHNFNVGCQRFISDLGLEVQQVQ